MWATAPALMNSSGVISAVDDSTMLGRSIRMRCRPLRNSMAVPSARVEATTAMLAGANGFGSVAPARSNAVAIESAVAVTASVGDLWM